MIGKAGLLVLSHKAIQRNIYSQCFTAHSELYHNSVPLFCKCHRRWNVSANEHHKDRCTDSGFTYATVSLSKCVQISKSCIFCHKIQTFMRMAELPWRLVLISGIPDSSLQSYLTSNSCHSLLTLRKRDVERKTTQKVTEHGKPTFTQFSQSLL